ncbi:dihydroorotase [Lachnoclostridium edouardi]|uniref:dihydroorotase n=1 Tax=Lachnoclostridium edouardi TaxID=1926283 RepID=UPI000C7CF558|nr:dihydroorotase [Lachnoclostridium edouardi]
MLLIKGGRVIDPKTGMDQVQDIVIQDGIIKTVGQADQAEYDKVIDASGKIVGPGLVDVHVHFRDPGLTYKEDIQTGAAAAAKGGFTTVVCMANTKPVVDNEETLEYVISQGKKTKIHVLAAAAISKGLKGQELTNMEELKAKGAAGFTDDGIPLMDASMVKKAMEEAARLDVPLSFHEEDPQFIQNNGISRGAVSEQLGIFGSPALAEDVLVARDCMLALHTGASVNIQHISSGNSVKMVELAKALGAKVTAEVTPHHFALTEDSVLEHGALAKMNPPLRTEKDRQQLIEGLKSGAIDIIATDHAPHSTEEKNKPLTEAPSGIIGLETALSLGIMELVDKGHLTMVQLMEKMSLNPARLYRLDKGYIEEGGPADLVIFDEKEMWRAEEFVSKAENSPFKGKELKGKVKYTICGGEIAYDDGEI